MKGLSLRYDIWRYKASDCTDTLGEPLKTWRQIITKIPQAELSIVRLPRKALPAGRQACLPGTCLPDRQGQARNDIQ